MTCRQLADFLSDYLAGTLESDVLDRFEAHLAECSTCVRFVENFRRAIGWGKRAHREEFQSLQEIPGELVSAILASRRAVGGT